MKHGPTNEAPKSPSQPRYHVSSSKTQWLPSPTQESKATGWLPAVSALAECAACLISPPNMLMCTHGSIAAHLQAWRGW